jgi:O-antigen/teichoic acid export membrane protein
MAEDTGRYPLRSCEQAVSHLTPPTAADARTPAMWRIARHTGALLMGEVATRALQFAVTVYVARTVGAAGFGLLAFAQVLLMFLAVVGDGGLGTYGVREMARAHTSRWAIWARVTGLRVALSTLAGVGAVGLVFLSRWDPLTREVVVLTLLAALPLAAMPDWAFRGTERMGEAAVLASLVPAVTLAGLVLTVHQPPDVVLVPAVRAGATAAVAAAGCLLWVRREGHSGRLAAGTWRMGPQEASGLARAGALLLVANLFVLAHANVDVVLVRSVLGDAAAGVYSAAYRLVQLPMAGFYVMTGAALPVLADLTRRPGEHGTDRALVWFGAVAGTLVAAGMWAARDPLVRAVYGTAFSPGIPVLGVLAWAIPLDFVVAAKGTAYVAAGREGPAAGCVAAAATTNVIANLLLLPRWGVMGAAVATVVSYTTLLALYVIFLDRAGRR